MMRKLKKAGIGVGLTILGFFVLVIIVGVTSYPSTTLSPTQEPKSTGVSTIICGDKTVHASPYNCPPQNNQNQQPSQPEQQQVQTTQVQQVQQPVSTPDAINKIAELSTRLDGQQASDLSDEYFHEATPSQADWNERVYRDYHSSNYVLEILAVDWLGVLSNTDGSTTDIEGKGNTFIPISCYKYSGTYYYTVVVSANPTYNGPSIFGNSYHYGAGSAILGAVIYKNGILIKYLHSPTSSPNESITLLGDCNHPDMTQN